MRQIATTSYQEVMMTCPEGGTPEIHYQARPDPLIGAVLDDRYRITRPIAEGGMGVVYEGIQLSIERPVAIKVIRDNLVHDPTTAKRFLREVRLLTAFSHPNVVEVYDYGQTDDGRPYLVMELLRGKTLDQLVARDTRLGLRRTCEIGVQLCDVVAAAHERGIVHRDLKPANIVIVEELGELVKVLDFGLAKSFIADEPTTVTFVGTLVGTPLYMAPEAITSAGSDPRSDLYALGCIFYELLTGATPFMSPAIALVLARQLDEAPPSLPADIPAPMRELIAGLLAKSPDHRPPSARAVREQLASFLVELDDVPTLIEPVPITATSPWRTLILLVAVAIALFCVVAFALP